MAELKSRFSSYSKMFARLPSYLVRDIAIYCYDEVKTSRRVARGEGDMMAWWFGWLKYRGVRCRDFMKQGRELLAYTIDDEHPRGQYRWLHNVFGFVKEDISREQLINALDNAIWSDAFDAAHSRYTDLDALKNYYNLHLFPHVEVVMRAHVKLWYGSQSRPTGGDWDATAKYTKRLARALRREARLGAGASEINGCHPVEHLKGRTC